jgi:hypothetical protein
VARFNEILVGRFNRFAQKYFGMKGGPVAAQLASEVSMFHEFFSGVENRALEGWFEYWAVFTVVSVAAVATAVRMRNPAGSNVVAVFEKIGTLFSIAADIPHLQMQPTNADLSLLGYQNNARRDARLVPQGALVGQQPSLISSGSDATHPGGLIDRQLGIGILNQAYDFIVSPDQEITLFPGDALQVTSNVANQNMPVNLMWRERPLEDSERAV